MPQLKVEKQQQNPLEGARTDCVDRQSGTHTHSHTNTLLGNRAMHMHLGGRVGYGIIGTTLHLGIESNERNRIQKKTRPCKRKSQRIKTKGTSKDQNIIKNGYRARPGEID